MNKAKLVCLLAFVCFVSSQSPLLRQVAVPWNSLDQLGNWIQQIQRSYFLDCPTNENRFGLSCDPAATSRDDLDNYFCGRSPTEFGWCGLFWNTMYADEDSPLNLNNLESTNKRGVSNGAIPINTNPELGENYQRYKMYLEMFSRVCSCHCGCARGCSSNMSASEGSHLFCGAPESPKIVISSGTAINIWADTSGSLSGTLPAIESMRETLLKDCLIQIYNNDDALYDERVNYISSPSERGILHLTALPNGANKEAVTMTVNCVFQDEADNVYYNSSNFSIESAPQTPFAENYNSDLTYTISNLTSGREVFGLFFKIDSPFPYVEESEDLHEMLQAVQNGDGWYSGTNGLAHVPEAKERIRIIYNTTAGLQPADYLGLLVDALNDLGFDLQC